MTIATTATTPENKTLTTFRSISGFALPSVIHNNQPLLQVSYFWNFRHRLVRYYWYIDITLHFPSLHHITLRYTHYITLRHVPWLRCITWHDINSHYITLHYITLHTYIHTYVHTYIHTDRQTDIHTHIHTYIHTYLHGSAYLTITSSGPACSQLHSRPSTRVERTAPKSLELGNAGGGNRNPKEGYTLYSP